MSQRRRNWLFTYNYTDEEQNGNVNFEPETFVPEDSRVRYAIWQLEVAPTTGRHHLQGYVECNCSIRLGSLKTLLGAVSVHLEPRRGSREQAIEYCRKDESRLRGPWERGDPNINPGRRSDLDSVADMLKDGSSVSDVAETYPSQYIRYRRGIESLHALFAERDTPKWRNVSVSVYYGPPGSGKTRRALEEAKDSVFILDQGERVWFDGYRGQSTLVIDDFYGWIKYGQLLRVLDGHPYRCEIKGGFTIAQWVRVVITSNKHPREWYSQGMSGALERRLTEIIEINMDDNP